MTKKDEIQRTHYDPVEQRLAVLEGMIAAQGKALEAHMKKVEQHMRRTQEDFESYMKMVGGSSWRRSQ